MSTTTRQGSIQRRTGETDIDLTLVLDGRGRNKISTGVGFMDHMLTLLAVHGFFDLEITARGDTQVDDHHTVEDLGIALGQALQQALGGKEGIARYGAAAVPMDETLVRVTLDCSNRPYLHYGVEVPEQKVGNFDTSLAKEFLRAFSLHGGLTLHVELAHGDNSHHIIEAIFKALGRALNQAVTVDPRLSGPLSSKGML
ncbi:imidazoleglycerol-phosphate dehydratase HisB [Desulfurivibrio alkaliphilus]|uniref:Imidazoleglycerol-phosphate dehydratase n=1 Tax=Desulfurivibrio alkaliphilus (strain DSM 19089 / UNIQEM U267 / AHT2) TaxID=589865 RepID=D6YZQ0_DESAT|nr:imidazoleglycerol-phosphate dehydratase HisB [Desulfurivibrio alkaliphilus]ADH85057.1 Imidazoleglycerol-phosphate dehydratase [Desulfurivibrio alkaliphilus AHT 2]